MRDYSEKELNDAFDMVQNSEHWKGPINAVVSPEKVDVVVAAIEYYAYGMAETTTLDCGVVRVKAPGYWGAEDILIERINYD